MNEEHLSQSSERGAPADCAGDLAHTGDSVRHIAPRPGIDEGEWVSPQWETVRNVEDEVIDAQTIENTASGLPFATDLEKTDRPIAVVGGAPSLKGQIKNLKALQAAGVMVWAVNAVPDYLREYGILTDVHVILDAKPHNARFVEHSQPGTRYFIATQAHPSVIASLKAQGRDVRLWHAYHPGMKVSGVAVCGPATVMGKAICLASILGHKQQYVFGMDGSYTGDEHHAYEQPENEDQLNIYCRVAGREFFCPRWGVHQAEDFIKMLPVLLKEGCQFQFFGDGLLQWWLSKCTEGESNGEGD